MTTLPHQLAGVPAAHSMHPNHSIPAFRAQPRLSLSPPPVSPGALGHKRSSVVKWVTTPRLTRPRLGGKEAGGARPPQSYEWFAKPVPDLARLPVRFASLAKHFLLGASLPSFTPSSSAASQALHTTLSTGPGLLGDSHVRMLHYYSFAFAASKIQSSHLPSSHVTCTRSMMLMPMSDSPWPKTPRDPKYEQVRAGGQANRRTGPDSSGAGSVSKAFFLSSSNDPQNVADHSSRPCRAQHRIS